MGFTCVNWRTVICSIFTFMAGMLFEKIMFSPKCVMRLPEPKSVEMLGYFTDMYHPDEQLDSSTVTHLAGKIERTQADPPRVSCWISSAPAYHSTKAAATAATWGKRCDHFQIMSTKPDSLLPVIALDIPEGYGTLWGKTKAAFRYMYDHYHHQTDWYFKADDDTYLVVENLKRILVNYDPNKSYILGCRYRGDFMSGGAGYVLSREALRRFIEEGLNGVCREGNSGNEDQEMAWCLHKLGTTIIDTTDELDRLRFLAFPPEDFIVPGRLVGSKAWYKNLAYYPIKTGIEKCCSDSAVTFHYISPERMFTLEYLLYHLKVAGRNNSLS